MHTHPMDVVNIFIHWLLSRHPPTLSSMHESQRFFVHLLLNRVHWCSLFGSRFEAHTYISTHFHFKAIEFVCFTRSLEKLFFCCHLSCWTNANLLWNFCLHSTFGPACASFNCFRAINMHVWNVVCTFLCAFCEKRRTFDDRRGWNGEQTWLNDENWVIFHKNDAGCLHDVCNFTARCILSAVVGDWNWNFIFMPHLDDVCGRVSFTFSNCT